MKKTFIKIFSLLFIIGISNTSNACGTCGCQDTKSLNVEQTDTETVKCDKAAKKECSSSKSKKGTFNFNNTNNYSGNKSACSKSKKKCCKSKKQDSDESTDESTDE